MLEINNDITAQKRAQERLSILHQIDQSILAAQAPAEIARAAIVRLQNITEALRVTVVMCDFAVETASILAAVGLGAAGYQAGARVPLAQYLMLAELRAGQVAAIEDMMELPAAWPAKDVTLRAGIRSVTLVPLNIGSQVIGVLTISRAQPGRLPPETLELAIHVADSLALAIHNARLHEQIQAGQAQLQALSHRLVELQERERSYVADRLYNEAAQVLAALKIQMATLEHDLTRLPASADRMGGIMEATDRVLQELHQLATQLRPASLDRLGLAAALQQHLAEFGAAQGLEVQFVTDGLAGVHIPPDLETGLYRIAQAALANTATHARATSAGLVLSCAAHRLVLTVEDNGIGFDADAALAAGALGLVDMRERAQALGGHLTIESGLQVGTTVIVEVPIDGAAAAER